MYFYFNRGDAEVMLKCIISAYRGKTGNFVKVEEGTTLSIIIFLLIISETGGLKKEMYSSRIICKRDAG